MFRKGHLWDPEDGELIKELGVPLHSHPPQLYFVLNAYDKMMASQKNGHDEKIQKLFKLFSSFLQLYNFFGFLMDHFTPASSESKTDSELLFHALACGFHWITELNRPPLSLSLSTLPSLSLSSF